MQRPTPPHHNGATLPGSTPPTHQHHQTTMGAATHQEHPYMDTDTPHHQHTTPQWWQRPSQHTTNTPTPPNHMRQQPLRNTHTWTPTHQIINTITPVTGCDIRKQPTNTPTHRTTRGAHPQTTHQCGCSLLLACQVVSKRFGHFVHVRTFSNNYA